MIKNAKRLEMERLETFCARRSWSDYGIPEWHGRRNRGHPYDLGPRI